MNTRMEQLRYKEVVSLADGTRFGYVGDLEVDTDLGQVMALIVPGRPRLLGLLGREPDRTIPWSAVRRFGEDIVLVDLPGPAGGLIFFTRPRPARWRRTTAPAAAPGGPISLPGRGCRQDSCWRYSSPRRASPPAGCGHF